MFTQNQIRQFLPVSDVVANNADMPSGIDNAGKAKVSTTPMGEYNVQYVDSTGKVVSFIIPEKSILWKKATPAVKMAYTSKATLVTVNPEYLIDHDNNNSTAKTLISGQDYMLNIRINSLYWDSDEVWGYKYGIVHATYGMSPSTFYKKLALSLAANFSREEVRTLKFFLLNTEFAEYSSEGSYSSSDTVSYNGKYYKATGSISDAPGTDTDWTEVSLFDQTTPGTYDYVVEVDSLTSPDSLNTTYYGVIIDEADEADRPWRLGMQSMQDIEYLASPSTINFSGEEVNWGLTETFSGSVTIGNGRKVADMEYFYHANRGDYNREAAWPNNWPSVEQINPASTYDIIDIHWSWEGNNHAIQRSEKDLTLAFVSTSHTKANAFIGYWNTVGNVDFSAANLNSDVVLN